MAGAGRGAVAQSGSDTEWLAYAARYVAGNGRIVDTANRGISHSEGQGYGMLLAVAYDDHATFDRIWGWTRRELQVRDDRLSAWKWDPLLRGGQVSDLNNASDGDLLIAWGLLEAASRWNKPALALAAQLILDDIEALLVADSRLGPVLIPGAHGFDRGEGLVLNPSYWVFPALERVGKLTGNPLWSALVQSGFALLDEARFGPHGLPPDWVELRSDGVALPDGFTPEFGFNAVRVPLYLAWASAPPQGLLTPFVGYASSFARLSDMPAVVDLETGFVSDYRISRGVEAIYQRAIAKVTAKPANLPRFDPRDDYYASTLLLLAMRPFEEFRA